jgi:tetratricopeptide (TPR) repeat protein
MIEATCTACGNINRVAETDIPVGSKFVNCASCKARVAIPTKTSLGASAPKPPAMPAPPPIPPAPKSDPLGLSDLPVPKRGSALGPDASKPAPRSGLAAALDSELPAPRGAPRPASVPASATPSALDLDDLLPPGAELGRGVSDLPTPRKEGRTKDFGDLPAPKATRSASDIPPARVPTLPSVAELPQPRGISDLPTPKAPLRTPIPRPPPVSTKSAPAPAPPKPAPASLLDLPMPKPAGPGEQLTPRRPSGIIDLPTPSTSPGTDLTPRAPSGIVDLPMPKSGGSVDLPAPKGFFDDLPQPASAAAQNRSDLPAPKGFFDDLPGRPNTSKADKPELPAPQGFFDDLPGRVNPNKPAAAEVPAPKGFFDDLPGRVNPNKPAPAEVPAPKGFFDDLPQPSLNKGGVKPQTQPPPIGIELGPALDLETPPTPGSSSQFDDLDLSTPTTGQMRVEGKRASTAQQPIDHDPLPPSASFKGAELQLEEPRPGVAPTSKLGPKRTKAASAKFDPLAAKIRAQRAKKVLLGVVLLGALGGGGFVLYRRHAAKQEAADQRDEELGKARKALGASDAGHWDKAFAFARRVLDSDDQNAEALGIAAESELASGLATGVNTTPKFTKARQLISTAVSANLMTPELVRAQALSSIVAKQPDRAIEKLKPLASAAPNNTALAIYLGWAFAAKGDTESAIKSFDQAVTTGVDNMKVLALYGRGRAKLARADLAGARADFAAVLELAKTHVGAQVGLAAAQPVASSQAQEADLMAILARKDLDGDDPRAVVHGWVLAADAAMRGNRLDVARERYRKALALVNDDVTALTGLAEVELRDNKRDAAAAMLKKAFAASPDDLRAQLVQIQLSIAKNDFKDASTRLATLTALKPPPPVIDLARIQLISGRLLDAQGDDNGALEAYLASAKLAGELDLTPTLAAVTKLNAMAGKDPAKATQLRARADELLTSLATSAQNDPGLALTLGMSYLQADDAAKAEPWLRRVVEKRPSDAEPQYQLAKALAKLGRSEDAISGMQSAITKDPTRTDIGLELARTFEAADRDADAGALYTKLLDATKDNLELRARGGVFFARTNQIDKAAEQGAKILAVEPGNAAGLYLKAEGLYLAQRFDEAFKLFKQAVDTDRDPQYLDGQGRAAEALALKDKDARFQDTALRAYMGAVEKAPGMFNPNAGMGRLYVLRREAAKAVPPLLAAYKIRADADVATNLGLAYKELQQNPTAIQWLSKAIELRPNAEASMNLGELYFMANDGAKAAKAYTVATDAALVQEKRTGKPVPWVTSALYRLGALQRDLRNDAATYDAWQKYVDHNPPKGAELNEVKNALATWLRKRQ